MVKDDNMSLEMLWRWVVIIIPSFCLCWWEPLEIVSFDLRFKHGQEDSLEPGVVFFRVQRVIPFFEYRPVSGTVPRLRLSLTLKKIWGSSCCYFINEAVKLRAVNPFAQHHIAGIKLRFQLKSAKPSSMLFAFTLALCLTGRRERRKQKAGVCKPKMPQDHGICLRMKIIKTGIKAQRQRRNDVGGHFFVTACCLKSQFDFHILLGTTVGSS